MWGNYLIKLMSNNGNELRILFTIKNNNKNNNDDSNYSSQQWHTYILCSFRMNEWKNCSMRVSNCGTKKVIRDKNKIAHGSEE